jgi:ribosome-binding factor A
LAGVVPPFGSARPSTFVLCRSFIAMPSHRQQRVSDLLHQELSILITELTDPRLADSLVIVTRVDVSADLRNARVYVEHALAAKDSPRVLAALMHAETFLRKALVENLDLRVIPHLTFTVDETTERARRVDELLEQIARQSPTPDTEKHEPDDTE